ncbi:MAG: ISNCY family transposase [Candidatus Omnitrophota bacterium]|nr:ISNCY family transposase [Candidatus Omnitrophota bacterium]
MDARRRQRSFGDGFVAEAVADLQEAWMRHADAILEDDQLVSTVYEALGTRHPKSRTRGRRGAPAEVVLRLLVLKHVRNWSYATVQREVRANLVYRDFTRVGGDPVPDAKTMGRWGIAVGPTVIEDLHRRLIAIAQQQHVVEGRTMRVDTTVVETNIHYPTDSSLMGDGVRVLTRVMKKVTAIAGQVGATLRDRRRSVTQRLWEIGRIARGKGAQHHEKLTRAYQQVVASTSRVVGQAKRFSEEIAAGVKRAADVVAQAALDGLRRELETFMPRVQQVMRQTRARVFGGDTHVEDKLLSLFEPSTEVIRKGKAGKPNEFGKMVKFQEAEHQIITAYVVYDTRPSDSDLLIPAIDAHLQTFGRVPRLVAADAAFYSGANEAAAHAKGVTRVCIPNRSTKSAERKREQKKRWFKNGQTWRTGCEGRISVVKRRHGLNRSRYKGDAGMKRWVGLGVIADNLINIGRVLATRAGT